MAQKKHENTTIAQNRKAFHDYFVEETLEAGIALAGTEVKSIRLGEVNLKDSWCDIKNGELLLKQMHISPYEKGNIFNKDPLRPRKLLLHKREILRLFSLVQREGYALVPLSLYCKGPHIKVAVGLCKGKKNYDKREATAARETKRDLDRIVKERNANG